MTRAANVFLKQGHDKHRFVGLLPAETGSLRKMLDPIPNMVALYVEDEAALRSHVSFENLEWLDEEPIPHTTLPDPIFFTGTITTEATVSGSANGADYMPLQFYSDTDVIEQTEVLGNDAADDDDQSAAPVSYYSSFFGEHVDIVTLEVGNCEASYDDFDTANGGHPDWMMPGTSTSRFVHVNWPDLEATDNNQVSNSRCFTSHGIGVLSAAAGTVCGFAKKANMHAMYLTVSPGVPSGTYDSTTECIASLITWHQAKANNPTTGVPNPTILINEYQYLLDNEICVLPDDIVSITDGNGTVNKPGGSEGTWGSDLSEFANRNIIPFRVDKPGGDWEWRISVPQQNVNTSLRTAIANAWDAGIYVITAAGNNAGVYNKYADMTNTSLTMKSSYEQVNVDGNGGTTSLTTSTSSTSTLYPFYARGPHGNEKAIEVGAGQNSQTNPILDGYSNRGPGIDIVGRGSDTWTSYPAGTYADGRWGYFGGTSCATPTVVGKAACELEKYFYYNGKYPTPDELKSILTNHGQDIVFGVDSHTWSSVPSATSFPPSPAEFEGTTYPSRIFDSQSSNGGLALSELAGSTTKSAFWNAKGFDRTQTQGFRPSSGAVYPRLRIKS